MIGASSKIIDPAVRATFPEQLELTADGGVSSPDSWEVVCLEMMNFSRSSLDDGCSSCDVGVAVCSGKVQAFLALSRGRRRGPEWWRDVVTAGCVGDVIRDFPGLEERP